MLELGLNVCFRHEICLVKKRIVATVRITIFPNLGSNWVDSGCKGEELCCGEAEAPGQAEEWVASGRGYLAATNLLNELLWKCRTTEREVEELRP